MKTAWTPSITACGEAPVPARAAKTAPRAAAPIAPPRPRKNVVVAIATPSRVRGTSFWTATTSTWPTMPKPRPNTASPMPVVVRDGSPVTTASSASPAVISARPAAG